MTDSIILEPGSRAAQNYTEGFFSLPPTDKRYVKSEFKPFLPITSLDQETFSYELPATTNGDCYGLGEAVMVTKVKVCVDTANCIN